MKSSSTSGAFKESALNNNCSQNYVTIFYLFRRANQQWWLFKKQALFEGIKHLRFELREDIILVKPQRDALKSHLHHLGILIGVCDSQIISSHNDSFKNVPQLGSIRNNVSVTLHLIFDAIKYDILGVIETISPRYQSTSSIFNINIPSWVRGEKICDNLLSTVANIIED